MLLGSLFKLVSIETEPGSIKAVLSIDRHNEIFDGHFPGQPVLPGVCMMQVIKELVEADVKQKLVLYQADNMKFLSVIDPTVHSEVNAHASYVKNENDFIVNASLFSGTVTFFK